MLILVALRKESVDRNKATTLNGYDFATSLSARRAWIEIGVLDFGPGEVFVALRKESVDRNLPIIRSTVSVISSLSARRAWIEILLVLVFGIPTSGRSPQGERG